MTDWGDYLACDICPALQSEACFDLSSGGPEALPEVRRCVPHSGRKLSARLSPKPAKLLRDPQKSTSTPGRRRAARTATAVESWQKLADRQQRRRDGSK